MGRAVSVAACALNQWALDFEGNLERIFRSEWGGGGGTGFAPRAPGSSSAGARWLPPPPPASRPSGSVSSLRAFLVGAAAETGPVLCGPVPRVRRPGGVWAGQGGPGRA